MSNEQLLPVVPAQRGWLTTTWVVDYNQGGDLHQQLKVANMNTILSYRIPPLIRTPHRESVSSLPVCPTPPEQPNVKINYKDGSSKLMRINFGANPCHETLSTLTRDEVAEMELLQRDSDADIPPEIQLVAPAETTMLDTSWLVDRLLWRRTRFRVWRWACNMFGQGNNRYHTQSSDQHYNRLLTTILNLDPAYHVSGPNGEEVSEGAALYQAEIRARLDNGVYRTPRYLKHLLDTVRSKWPLLTDTEANRLMVWRLVSDKMREDNVRKTISARMLPVVVALSMLPNEADLEAQNIENCMTAIDLRESYNNSIQSLTGARRKPPPRA